MKELLDGTKVSSKSYYYLLDWNDNDRWKFITSNFNTNRLHRLNINEYKILWKHATTDEFNKL